jgi:uncharacterized damage-inducible protein DinB
MATMVASPAFTPLLNEFREEVAITKRILERVPADKVAWKPHAKSMTLGQLAWHVATIPGGIARIAQLENFDVLSGSFVPPQPASLQEILAAYEQAIPGAEKFLAELTDERASGSWRLLKGDRELFSQPRINVVRTIMLNHWYHHRGQLSVYLRLLDVALPVIYGRSADEDPFA